MEEHAQVILSRFPAGSQFLTNTRHGGDNPDFYERLTGCWPRRTSVSEPRTESVRGRRSLRPDPGDHGSAGGVGKVRPG
jgi:hypothetical protein